MFATFRWVGLRRMIKKLHKLKKTQAKSIWRKAVRAGARPIIKTARSLVPEDTKVLKRSLAVRVVARRKDGVIFGIVGPRTKFKKLAYERKRGKYGGRMALKWASKYAHIVHGGRKTYRAGDIRRTFDRRRKRKDGRLIIIKVDRLRRVPKATSAIPPCPFLAKAIRIARAASLAAMRDKIKQELGKLKQ